MNSAHVLRSQIEAVFTNRIPAALSLSPRIDRPVTSTGNPTLDDALAGGFPVAAITELMGLDCSGRTTTVLAYLASLTGSGSICAWIDVTDTLDPQSVAANGVDLKRLLWIRCGPRQRSSQAINENKQSRVSSLQVSDITARHTGGGSLHPRSEGQDMPQAPAAMLHSHGGLYDCQVSRKKKVVGTPSAPNRRMVSRSEQREEQVNSDRLPPRRGDNLAMASRYTESQSRHIASVPSGESTAVHADSFKTTVVAVNKRWQAVDQGLRAADLLLQAGGFSAMVFDLGSTPPEIAWRIPLATWFRFRAACERTRVSLLLLTQHPCARSAAELTVRLEGGSMVAESRIMTGIRYRATTERHRSSENERRVVSILKPLQSKRPGQWTSEASWAQTK